MTCVYYNYLLRSCCCFTELTEGVCPYHTRNCAEFANECESDYECRYLYRSPDYKCCYDCGQVCRVAVDGNVT